jgi:hypothetical protein
VSDADRPARRLDAGERSAYAFCVKQAFLLRGGPQDGVHLDPSVEGPHPETLFAIHFDDGASGYARAGQCATDDDGTVREIFDFDATGTRIDAARRRFARLTVDDSPKS